MNYCPDCGTKLKDEPSVSSWELVSFCTKCKLRVVMTYGDMGGAGNHYHFDRSNQIREKIEKVQTT